MKTGLLLCFQFIIFCAVKAQTFDDPGSYMNAMNNAHVEMDQRYMTYMSAAAHGRRKRKVEKLRQQTLESVDKSLNNTAGLPAYKGDNSLRQAAMDYIKFCYRIFNDDYAHIVNMEEIAEQSVDQMQAYLLLQEKTDEKLQEANAKINQADKDFAAKYHVNLIETKNELGEKMTAAGQLNRYTNRIYLIFFKPNWEESELTKALNAKNLNAAEQARSALLKYATDGLEALKADSLKSFKNDPLLANTCRRALEFYKKEAEVEVPKMIDYNLKQENFTKIKKAMDAKANRTREDVDAFNKSVREINQAVEVYNQSNQNLNSQRAQLMQYWEADQNSFADAHMPYYKK